VFNVAAIGLDASVKMSSPLLKCRVNHSMVKFDPYRHNADQTVKVILSKLYVALLE